MTFPVELLRSYSVSGLHNVQKGSESTFKAWITNTKYKISTPKKKDSFLLDVYDHNEIIRSYAFDINRMACSSFESMAGISCDSKFPKSIGWIIIRLYYSTYFSVHAILRIYGKSCTQFDHPQANAIDSVAKIYDQFQAGTPQGYFLCEYDCKNKLLECNQLGTTHKDVWNTFFKLLEQLANEIPTSSYLQTDRNEAVTYLFNLRELLSMKGKHSSGNWLSLVRNEINYSHSWGAWFPHSGSLGLHREIVRLISNWSPKSTELLTVPDTSDKELPLSYVEACLSTISLCKELVLDIHQLNTKGFLAPGAAKCLNLCASPVHLKPL